MVIYGIDVSRHQGVIDWATVSAELKRVNMGLNSGFVMIRAGYSARAGSGGFVPDTYFLQNVIGCQKFGVPYGVYCYSYDQSAEAAAITATELINYMREYQVRPCYPVVYDIEYESFNKAVGKDINTAIVKGFANVVEREKYYFAVYASRSFFSHNLNDNELKMYDHWVANWINSLPLEMDRTNVQMGMLQFSSTNYFNIKGFAGALDCNAAFKDYESIIKTAGLNGYKQAASAPIYTPVPEREYDGTEKYSINITGADKSFAAAIAAVCKAFDVDYLLDME